MGIRRRRVISLLAPVSVVSLSGCNMNRNSRRDEDRRPSTPFRRQSTNPVRGVGEEAKIIVRRPSVELVENSRVKNATTGEILSLSRWRSSIATVVGTTELPTIVSERSGIDPQEFNVLYQMQDHSFLVSVLVEGPPEGVQELAGPKYFMIKESCPHKLLLLIKTQKRTISHTIPVYVRAVLDPVSG